MLAGIKVDCLVFPVRFAVLLKDKELARKLTYRGHKLYLLLLYYYADDF